MATDVIKSSRNWTQAKQKGSSGEEACLCISTGRGQPGMRNHDVPYPFQPINKEHFFGKESKNNCEINLALLKHKIYGIGSAKAII